MEILSGFIYQASNRLITFDVIFPLIYAFVLTTTLNEIFDYLLISKNPLRRINLLPIPGMCFAFINK
jgi:hypothetical protein